MVSFLLLLGLAGLAVGTFSRLVELAWLVLLLAGRWRMFEKMREPGWEGLIPLYADYILYKKCWETTAFWVAIVATVAASVLGQGFLASAASLVVTVVDAKLCWELSRRFGHGILFAVGLVLFNPIFVLYLGFGPDFYRGRR